MQRKARSRGSQTIVYRKTKLDVFHMQHALFSVDKRPLQNISSKGFRKIAAYYRKNSGKVEMCRHIIYELAYCGDAAIPLLLNIKAYNERRGKHKHIWALKSLAMLQHQPTLEELKSMITKSRGVEMDSAAVHYMIERSMRRLLGPFAKFNGNSGTFQGKLVGLMLLHYYREKGIEILRAQLKTEKDPLYKKLIRILIKRAPFIEERENEYLIAGGH